MGILNLKKPAASDGLSFWVTRAPEEQGLCRLKARKSFAYGCYLGNSKRGSVLRALYLVGLHALGAHIGATDVAALVLDGNLLDIRTEGAVGNAM